MLRALAVLAACLCLGGCWTSETDLFAPGDLSPPQISGEYIARSLDADPNPVTVSAGPGRMLSVRYRDPESGAAKAERWSFVKIPGIEAAYYLTFESDAKDSGAIELRKGHLYFLTRLDDDGNLLFYLPDCEGTRLSVAGLDRGDGTECKFTTKGALLAAARQAAGFIDGKNIVPVAPAFELARPPGKTN